MRSYLPLLLGSFSIGLATFAVAQQPAETVSVDADSAVTYLQSCRKANGAFGPAGQDYTDAAWNYPAVHALRLLDETISQPQQILEHGIDSPPGHGGYGHWQFFHEHQIRALLQEPFHPQHATVELIHQGWEPRYYGSPFGTQADLHFKPPTGAERTTLDRSRQQFGFYNLSSLYYLLAGLQASERKASNVQALAAFIRQRQAPCGGFVDVRTEKPEPRNAEVHLVCTFHAIAALQLLGEKLPRAEDVAKFVHSCQRGSGSFGWNANQTAGDDVYYTWAALRTLELLGERPRRAEDCTRSIQSLQNADGGFGDRPGWRSRLYSTYYAIHALKILHGDPRRGIVRRTVFRLPRKAIAEGDFRIYQALFKMPVVQPKDLPELSRRGFHLLGLKSAKFDDAQPLLAAIRQQQLPLDVVLTPEAYPHRITGAGGLVLNHVGNFTLDPRWTTAQQARWLAADQVGQASKTWPTYCEEVLRPLHELKGLSYPEQDFEMEHAYIAYDRPGYNAVLAGFNWAPRDFVRVFPWRERYTTQLTPIADADAHGDLTKWSDQLDHTRMLFIARGPTYADFLDAVANQRVTCVIAQPAGVAAGFSVYGPPAATQYLRKHVEEWRWWAK